MQREMCPTVYSQALRFVLGKTYPALASFGIFSTYNVATSNASISCCSDGDQTLIKHFRGADKRSARRHVQDRRRAAGPGFYSAF